jgi:hypothetical protein
MLHGPFPPQSLMRIIGQGTWLIEDLWDPDALDHEDETCAEKCGKVVAAATRSVLVKSEPSIFSEKLDAECCAAVGAQLVESDDDSDGSDHIRLPRNTHQLFQDPADGSVHVVFDTPTEVAWRAFQSMDQAALLTQAYHEWLGRPVDYSFLDAVGLLWGEDQASLPEEDRPVLEWLEEHLPSGAQMRTPLYLFHEWPVHKDAVLGLASVVA